MNLAQLSMDDYSSPSLIHTTALYLLVSRVRWILQNFAMEAMLGLDVAKGMSDKWQAMDIIWNQIKSSNQIESNQCEIQIMFFFTPIGHSDIAGHCPIHFGQSGSSSTRSFRSFYRCRSRGSQLLPRAGSWNSISLSKCQAVGQNYPEEVGIWWASHLLKACPTKRKSIVLNDNQLVQKL